MQLLDAIGIDSNSFMNGAIRASFLAAGFKWEQLHTTVGRVFTAAFAGTVFGLEHIQTEHLGVVDGMMKEVVDKAAATGKLAGQTLCSVLPTFVLVPALTGWLRSSTDVFEGFSLDHGFPTLAPGLEAAGDMDAKQIRTQRKASEALRAAFEAIDWDMHYAAGAFPQGLTLADLSDEHRAAVEALVDGMIDLCQAADTDFKLSMGAYKAASVGKAAGMVMQGLGTGVTALSLVKRYDLAFYMAVGLIPLQPFSGMQDKNAMATYYMDAGMKWDWKSLVLEPYRNLPAAELRPEHMDVRAGGKRWSGRDEAKIKAVRERCNFELAAHVGKLDELLEALMGQQQQLRASSSAPSAARKDEIREIERALASTADEIEGWREDIRHFDTLDAAEWEQISHERLGRYLDDSSGLFNELAMAQRSARTSKPGEVLSQILQRYKQLSQDLPFSYAALYATSKIMVALGVSHVVAETILAIGALDWTLNTEQTRADKAKDKPVLGKPLVDNATVDADRAGANIGDLRLPTFEAQDGEADDLDADGEEQPLLARYKTLGRWTAEHDGKQVPLTSEAAYRARRPGKGERLAQLWTVAKSGVFSGPRAVGRLAGARAERAKAHKELEAIERAFRRARFAMAPPPAIADGGSALGKGTSMVATRARIEDFAAVRQYLNDDAARKASAANSGT